MSNKQAVPSRDQYFVLNTHEPAKCNGNISAFQFCYYSPIDIANSTQKGGFSFSIFRQNNSNGAYHRVHKPILVSADIIISNTTQFICSRETLNDTLPVKKDDVFGACISSVGTTKLDVVGNYTDFNSEAYLHVAGGDRDCGDSFPAVLENGTLSRTKGLVLHLVANITSNSSGNPQGQSPGEIAAITVPLVLAAVLAIVIVIIFWCCKKAIIRKSSSTEPLFQSTRPGIGKLNHVPWLLYLITVLIAWYVLN